MGLEAFAHLEKSHALSVALLRPPQPVPTKDHPKALLRFILAHSKVKLDWHFQQDAKKDIDLLWCSLGKTYMVRGFYNQILPIKLTFIITFIFPILLIIPNIFIQLHL